MERRPDAGEWLAVIAEQETVRALAAAEEVTGRYGLTLTQPGFEEREPDRLAALLSGPLPETEDLLRDFLKEFCSRRPEGGPVYDYLTEGCHDLAVRLQTEAQHGALGAMMRW